MHPCEQVRYLLEDNVFVLKLIGTLRFNAAPYLDAALSYIPVESINDIIIDMTQTNHIDSTILGSIAKYFISIENHQRLLKKQPIIVFKDEDVKQTFSKIGFDKFFIFQNAHSKINTPIESFSWVEEPPNADKSIKNCVLQAHKVLNELQPNDPSLKLVVQLLKDK